MQVLLKHGADPDRNGGNGDPFVHAAVSLGSLECLKILFEHGADVHALDSEGLTLLQLSLEKNEDEIFDYLIEQGLDVDQARYNGKFPVYYCAAANKIEQLKKLVE